MIQITNAFFEVNSGMESPLGKLCKYDNLPTKTSYWLSRLLQKLEPLHKVYLGEKQKLIDKWCDRKEDGTPDVEGQLFKVSLHMQEFNGDLQELLSIELSLDMDKIKVPLDKIPDGLLNSYDFNLLENVIVFTEEK